LLKHCVFLAPLFLVFSLNGEPSAFEKQSGVTKNDIKTLQNLVSKLQQKVDSIGQAQEGISSLYESQSSKLHQQVSQGVQNAKDIEEIKAQLDTNSKDIATIKAQMKEINATLTTLSQTILSELKELSNNPIQTTSTNQKNTATNKQADSKAPTFTKDKAKRADIFTQAQNLFNKKEYESAKVRFEWLIEINYKKAHSSFYLAEIAFANKSHNEAIKLYKESAIANDKASYMPTLLLHTAQSFNAIKDTKNYNRFLDTLISNYPSSKEAQSAKNLKSKNKDKNDYSK